MKVGDIKIEEMIFEQTKQLLLQYGIKDWNMSYLAKRCEMSKRTLYKIIESKEDLLKKMFQKIIEQNISQTNSFYCSGIPCADYKEFIINRFQEYVMMNIRATKNEYPEISKMISGYVDRLKEIELQIFERGIKENHISNDCSAELYVKMLHVIVEYNILNYRDNRQFKSELRQMLNVFFSGIMV